MIHPSASPQPRPAGRGIPRIRRWAAGLAVAALASLAGAPAALAGPCPRPADPSPTRSRRRSRPPRRPPTSRYGPSSPSWPPPPSCPSPPPSSRCPWNTGTAPAAPRPRPAPRPTCNPRQPRRNPRPGRATSSAATSTRPAMTCTGPTAGKGPAPLRQPPGVILNGRRTASPSATWRTIRAPASSACRTTGRDQDVVMKASRAEVSDSATPDVRSRAATSWAAGLSQQRLRRRDHLAPVILHRPRPRAVRHHQPLNPHPVPPLIGCGKP